MELTKEVLKAVATQEFEEIKKKSSSPINPEAAFYAGVLLGARVALDHARATLDRKIKEAGQ